MHSSATHDQVFDINDFTSASDWEKFISDLEQALRQWDLSSGQHKAGSKRLSREQLSAVSWSLQSLPIKFNNVALVLHHYHAKDLPDEEPLDQHSARHGNELPVALMDTASCDHDFVNQGPAITRLFGLREFVIIASADKTQPISSIDRVKLLISSVAISVGNIKCSVPVFAHVAANHYTGILIDAEKRTNFEMVCLREVPSKFKHLSALLSVFKEKLGHPATDSLSVRVSVRFVNQIRRSD
jgi:Rab3 GTPase-activating protein catalytic subunit